MRPKCESDVAEMSTKLSVVVPARSEEQDIERSLRSVLSQRGVDLQVIVVNDNSTDRTGEIIHGMADSDVRITVVDDPSLKTGWLGKPNAMQRGVMEASNDLILFCGADIIHSPTCFATGISQLEVSDLGIGLAAGDIRLFSIGLLQPLISVLCLARIRFLCEFKWRKAVCFPQIAIPMACVLARSFYEQTIRRTLIWRDREINLDQQIGSNSRMPPEQRTQFRDAGFRALGVRASALGNAC